MAGIVGPPKEQGLCGAFRERSISRESVELLLETEDREMVQEELQNLKEYATCVSQYKKKADELRKEVSNRGTKWYQDMLLEMKENKEIKHNVAVSSISLLNKLAEIHGIAPVYPSDPKVDARKEIVECILKYFKDELTSTFEC